MKNTTLYRRLPIWLVTVLLSTALWVSSANVAVGQTNDETAYQEAVSHLEQFKKEVLGMRSVVSKPLGPYPIEVYCTYCSTPLFCTTIPITFPPVDFTGTRQSLSRLLEQTQQNVSTFSRSYEPTQAWINGIPGFSAKFDESANIVLSVQKQIKEGVGPNDQQRETVTEALQELTKDLDRSSSLLQSGTSTLAAFLQQQSAAREAIRQAIDGANQSAQESLTAWQTLAINSVENEALISTCKYQLPQKYEAIRAKFSGSIQEISGAFQQLEGSSRVAEKSLAQLLGAIVSSQTEINTVLNLVNAAGNANLGSFLEQLNLNTAKKLWSNLADYAVANLSK